MHVILNEFDFLLRHMKPNSRNEDGALDIIIRNSVKRL
jgi:hypothetical protein